MPARQPASARNPAPMPDGRLLMDGFARWILTDVEPRADRVRYVREQTLIVLDLWRVHAELTWAVELLLTELATNALRHARTPFTVILTWDGHLLRGEVTDTNPQPLRVQPEVSPEAQGDTASSSSARSRPPGVSTCTSTARPCGSASPRPSQRRAAVTARADREAARRRRLRGEELPSWRPDPGYTSGLSWSAASRSRAACSRSFAA